MRKVIRSGKEEMHSTLRWHLKEEKMKKMKYFYLYTYWF